MTRDRGLDLLGTVLRLVLGGVLLAGWAHPCWTHPYYVRRSWDFFVRHLLGADPHAATASPLRPPSEGHHCGIDRVRGSAQVGILPRWAGRPPVSRSPGGTRSWSGTEDPVPCRVRTLRRTPMTQYLLAVHGDETAPPPSPGCDLPDPT